MQKIQLPKYQGNSLLLHAVSHSNVQDVIALLEQNEADVNAQNINGASALHYAVTQADFTAVTILLKYKANPNIQEFHDVGKRTPLHIAVEKNLFQICEKLLVAGANPNEKDKRGLTALHYAARFGFKEITNLLLVYGADVHLRDNNGFNASYWAEVNKHTDILTILPPPKSIPPDDMLEFKLKFREVHGIVVKSKKKKKKKKKK